MSNAEQESSIENPFLLLGLTTYATEKDVQTAFKKIAKIYHPDNNEGSEEFEEKFKIINIAKTQCLNIIEKRKTAQTKKEKETNATNTGFIHIKKSKVDVNNFEKISLNIPIETLSEGGEFKFYDENLNKMVNFEIKPGIRQNDHLKDPENPQKIYRTVFQPIENPNFTRNEENIIFEKIISYPLAVLGGTIQIPHFNKKYINVEIPKGTQNNSYLRLKGKGYQKENGERGDFTIKIKIDIPKHINEEEEEILKKYLNILGEKRQPINTKKKNKFLSFIFK